MPAALPVEVQSTRAAKPGIVNRVLAKLIDIAIVIAFGAILPYPLGPLLGFAYSLVADGAHFGKFRGQSLGKRAMHLQVVHQASRQPIGFKESLIRNAPVGVATFFAIIPVWGWLILLLVGAPLMVIEVYLMWSVESGHRLGDVMADTEVIDTAPKKPADPVWPGE